MVRTSTSQTGNRLLDLLPPEELHRLESSWEVVTLRHTQEIYREDGPLSHVYFPLSGLCAVIIRLQDGRTVEAGTVGNEGMIGLTALLDLDFSSMTVTTPFPGRCLRVPVDKVRRAVSRSTSLDRLLRHYIAFALLSTQHTVVCNAVHSAEERMCRWLLTTEDRLHNGPLTLTHEFLAQLLGVRRQTVTVIAGTLQSEGLIASRRGLVRIVNRKGLEATSCECYANTKSVYERIVGSERNN